MGSMESPHFSEFEPLTISGQETAWKNERGLMYEWEGKWVVKSIAKSGKRRVRVQGKPKDADLIKIASVLCPDVDWWDVEEDSKWHLFRSVVEK